MAQNDRAFLTRLKEHGVQFVIIWGRLRSPPWPLASHFRFGRVLLLLIREPPPPRRRGKGSAPLPSLWSFKQTAGSLRPEVTADQLVRFQALTSSAWSDF